MEHNMVTRAAELLKKNSRRKRWHRALTAMAAVVVFTTSYMMILPAITLSADQPQCGMEEHTHTEACYETQLVCGQEESGSTHTHGEGCYTQQKTLTCTLTEGEGHAHSDSCYGNVCGLEETAGHTHTDECYTQVPEKVLTCTEAESAGHTHGDGCYDESGALVCTEAESAGHTHGDGCYTESYTFQLNCGQQEAEAHTHSDSCRGLICGQTEQEAHTHSDACYTTENVLTCTEPEGHVHTDACYEQVLVCELPEHTHTDACYPAEEPQEPELICTVPEHVHEENCYDADGNLTCTMEEHTHTDECYAVVEEIPEEETPLGAFPEELPEGYVEYTFDSADGLTVRAMAPENAFGEVVELYAQVLAEDSEEYQKAQENLDNADNVPEYTGMAAMDIRFVPAGCEEPETAEEIEPDASMGPIYVQIDAQALLPEDVDESTLAVQHHTETTDGGLFGTGLFEDTEITVETVADSSTETGEVIAMPSDVTAEAVPLAAEPAEETTEDAAPAATMDVEAKFGVESFSTFTITWSSPWGGSSTVTVHYVDDKGNEIYSGTENDDIAVQTNKTIDLKEYIASIEHFDFQTIKLDYYDHNGDEASQIKYNGEWNFSNNGNYWRSWEGRTVQENNRWVTYYDVYIVYRDTRDIDGLDIVNTVDSTAEGVHMYMRNFDGKAFNGGEYDPGDVKEGLASSTVNRNGWPTLKDGGKSFAEVFFDNKGLNAYNMSNNYEVNKLFLKSEFDKNGTFYYSSFENFATLKNDADKNFTVYEQLGTPNSGESYFYQRGNFMPYNTLNTDNIANYNLYDDMGIPLTDADERVNEPVYGLNEKADFHFGMYIWADFYQPQDGMVEDNEGDGKSPMIFEFTGDDDMWVYIDGVLVLDLGGIHDAQSGSINFTDGTIRFTDTKTNEEPVWKESTLRAQYRLAEKEESVDWNGNTFADGSNHRIQIFYMERGEGASNLKISFNLKTIPDGQLAVSKKVEHYYAPQLKDVEYTMQVTVNGQTYHNQPYTIFGTEEGGTTDAEGKFNLKHNQTAVFADLTVGDRVMVREVGTSDTETGVEIEQNYDIAYTVTDGAGNTTGSEGNDGTITATMPGYGSISVTVTNTATFTRPLKLIKNFSTPSGNQPPQGFEATYTLYEVTQGGNVEIGSIRYSELVNGEYTFWLDTGKDYTIVESFDGDGDNKAETDTIMWLGVDTTTNDPVIGTQAEEGIVHLDENDATTGNEVDTITLTNRYGEPSGNLSITKKVNRTDGGDVDPTSTFEFTVQMNGINGSYSANYVNETSGGSTHNATDGETQVTFTGGTANVTLYAGETVTIIGLPAGVSAEITEINHDGYSAAWSDTKGTQDDPTTDIASTADARVTTEPIFANDPIEITCTNTTGAVLPSTGGPGVGLYLTLGSTLTFGAGLLLFLRRRKEGGNAV